jgi:hypothetical protein
MYKYNTYSHKNMSPNNILVVIPEDLYISHFEILQIYIVLIYENTICYFFHFHMILEIKQF